MLSVVSCQLSIINGSFVLIAASSNMSWGGKKQRGEECIGAFKRQRRSNAADAAGSNDAAAGDILGPFCLPENVKLHIVAWGAEYKYGGKGGSALACFFFFTFAFTTGKPQTINKQWLT